MNKRAIWLIIGLMSAALIGISILQVNWIREAIQLNEDRFDKLVRTALKNVVERLEADEERQYISYMNGYSTSYWQEQETRVDVNGNVVRSLDLSIAQHTKPYSRTLDVLNNDCNFQNCQKEKIYHLRQFAKFNENISTMPLGRRINIEHLNSYLEQELMDSGIEIDYQLGVFDSKKNSFVIVNDHYVVEDDRPKEFLPGFKNLYNSQYYVSLFPSKTPSPGLLMIHFPDRSSVVWGEVWRNLLASILFTGIILFCFAYTIHVIFQQKKLSKMKTDFINNMTHEFKTPIATISLAADSISSPIISGNPDKIKRFANIIKQENRRMNSQVEKVLQMAMLDKRDFNLNLTEVNLHEVIHPAVENITLQVEQKDGTVHCDLQATQPVIEADLTHVSNIINNLLDNANKYSPNQPEITVRTRDRADGVEVSIEDRGIGMSKEAKKHIFDRFYRVHTGDLHDVKGFGLGLSYVKAMMMAHKGSIDVKSELGKGSSFILFFPNRQQD